MKCYKVSQNSVTPYLQVSKVPYPHVGVGEEGRGRKYMRFPLGKRFAESLIEKVPCSIRGMNVTPADGKCLNCGIEILTSGEDFCGRPRGKHPDAGEMTRYRNIERASVIKTKERQNFLLVEEKDSEDKRALVLVNIEAGYRGYTHWTGAEYHKKPCSRRGNKGVSYVCDLCGTHYPAFEDNNLIFDEKNVHPDEGFIYDYEPFPTWGITVLAEGYCAQGAAGRMGGHEVKFLIMEPGTVFRVCRGGRLYGAPAARYVKWDGENMQVGTRDEIFLPSEEEEEGVLL